MLLLNESWNGDKYDSRKHDKAATLEWLIFSDGYEVINIHFSFPKMTATTNS